MMASTAASVTSITRRAAGRGRRGAGAPFTNSSVMDLANNRLSSSSSERGFLEQYGSKFLAGQTLQLRHGYRRGWCQGKFRLNHGGQDVAEVDDRGTPIGSFGAARL